VEDMSSGCMCFEAAALDFGKHTYLGVAEIALGSRIH
jgi:hypothetical protein